MIPCDFNIYQSLVVKKRYVLKVRNKNGLVTGSVCNGASMATRPLGALRMTRMDEVVGTIYKLLT